MKRKGGKKNGKKARKGKTRESEIRSDQKRIRETGAKKRHKKNK